MESEREGKGSERVIEQRKSSVWFISIYMYTCMCNSTSLDVL